MLSSPSAARAGTNLIPDTDPDTPRPHPVPPQVGPLLFGRMHPKAYNHQLGESGKRLVVLHQPSSALGKA